MRLTISALGRARFWQRSLLSFDSRVRQHSYVVKLKESTTALTNHSESIWKDRIDAHHDQSAQARQANVWDDADSWGTASPPRIDDQVLNQISNGIDQGTWVIDVGEGAAVIRYLSH